MKLLLDSFWRAGAYLFLPRVMGLTLLPLLLASLLALGLGWLFWESAVAGVRSTLEGWSLVAAMLQWIGVNLGESWRSLIGPIIVLALAVPLIVVMSLLLVAWFTTPSVARLVRERRFASMEQRHGASFLTSVAWSVGCTLVALLALALTMPLWLIPPLVLIIPPLIWGWLTRQVLAFDVLADTASAAERRTLVAEHRWPLLLMGVVTGYLGAAPSLIWAVGGAAALIFAPVMVAVAVWLYTLVFAFAALWFAHYALAALDALRRSQAVEVTPVDLAPAPEPLPPAAEAPRLP
jgi:Etoposide-induced protein 2.4 (EI24)